MEVKLMLPFRSPGYLLQCVRTKLFCEVQGVQQSTDYHVVQRLGMGRHDTEGIVAILTPIPVAAHGKGVEPVVGTRLHLGN